MALSGLDLLLVIFLLIGHNVGSSVIDHFAIYDSAVQLDCQSRVFEPGNTTGLIYQWLLPSGLVVGQPRSEISFALNSSSRVTILNNGASLLVKKVDKPDFGLYLCILFQNKSDSVEVIHVIKHGLNLDGPYYGDQLAKYQPNIKYGLIAGGTVFVFMSLICCNLEQAHVRYDKKLKRKDKGHEASMNFPSDFSQPISTLSDKYYNNGFVFDSDDDDVSAHNVDGENERKTRF